MTLNRPSCKAALITGLRANGVWLKGQVVACTPMLLVSGSRAFFALWVEDV